jgi:hypothetical protein
MMPLIRPLFDQREIEILQTCLASGVSDARSEVVVRDLCLGR